jgi:hypothetical protein
MILRGDVALFSERISTMASNLRLSSLIPAGLIVESAAEDEGVIFGFGAVRIRSAGLPGYVGDRRAASTADTSVRLPT